MRSFVVDLSGWMGVSILLMGSGWAQTPASSPQPASKPVAASAMRIDANMNQLMQGIVYPNSNVIFSTQTQNPADVKPAARPAVATDPLASSFGKWQAVENSALAIAESANLLMIAGRKCSNGVDVPVKNADWTVFVEELRSAGMTAYKAAQSRNQESMIAATDPLNEACQNCHGKYRNQRNPEDRCR